MKKKLSFLIIIFIAFQMNAQRGLKVAYVDMEYILDNVPEYRQASGQLESKAQQWRTEIESKQTKIDKLKDELEKERPLLTPELIQDMEDEIEFQENKLLEYRNKRFGVSGDFITQKRQLIQPIQDQVFNSIQEIGESRGYDFIFENSADALLLFSAKRHDISEIVLKMIKRNARTDNQDENIVEELDDYKSVEKAEQDSIQEKERIAEREEKEEERQEQIDDRESRRDSIRAARQKEFEERRERILKQREERERQRDSIRKAREDN
ncbi:MAG: OmpH family outer membrane protein [Psychroflexus sp.]